MRFLTRLEREIEEALERAPAEARANRYAVYLPDGIVIGTYRQREEAELVAEKWLAVVEGVVVVDRGLA